MITTCLISIAFTLPAQTNGKLRPLLDAIRDVETGGHPDAANARGDGGRSLGPYQISREYWRDSGVPGSYQMVRQTAYAERVMRAYWGRHCPRALMKLDFHTLARVHNAGPDGATNRGSLPYWRRVRDKLGS
jgi:hypothetical protein